MEDSDLIALAALIVTALGWIANFLVQMAVAQQNANRQERMQERLKKIEGQLQHDRETRGYLVPSKLRQLDYIANWFETVLQIVTDAFVVISADDTETDEASYAATLNEIKQRSKAVAPGANTCFVYAKMHDPMATDVARWRPDHDRDYGEIPSDLAQQVEATRLVMSDLWNLLSRRDDEDIDDLYDEMRLLHASALNSLERARKHILSTGLEVPSH